MLLFGRFLVGFRLVFRIRFQINANSRFGDLEANGQAGPADTDADADDKDDETTILDVDVVEAENPLSLQKPTAGESFLASIPRS